ncbi:hypothetical protein VaNZ11_016533, partial [Volvox africanus]
MKLLAFFCCLNPGTYSVRNDSDPCKTPDSEVRDATPLSEAGPGARPQLSTAIEEPDQDSCRAQPGADGGSGRSSQLAHGTCHPLGWDPGQPSTHASHICGFMSAVPLSGDRSPPKSCTSHKPSSDCLRVARQGLEQLMMDLRFLPDGESRLPTFYGSSNAGADPGRNFASTGTSTGTSIGTKGPLHRIQQSLQGTPGGAPAAATQRSLGEGSQRPVRSLNRASNRSIIDSGSNTVSPHLQLAKKETADCQSSVSAGYGPDKLSTSNKNQCEILGTKMSGATAGMLIGSQQLPAAGCVEPHSSGVATYGTAPAIGGAASLRSSVSLSYGLTGTTAISEAAMPVHAPASAPEAVPAVAPGSSTTQKVDSGTMLRRLMHIASYGIALAPSSIHSYVCGVLSERKPSSDHACEAAAQISGSPIMEHTGFDHVHINQKHNQGHRHRGRGRGRDMTTMAGVTPPPLLASCLLGGFEEQCGDERFERSQGRQSSCKVAAPADSSKNSDYASAVSGAMASTTGVAMDGVSSAGCDTSIGSLGSASLAGLRTASWGALAVANSCSCAEGSASGFPLQNPHAKTSAAAAATAGTSASVATAITHTLTIPVHSPIVGAGDSSCVTSADATDFIMTTIAEAVPVTEFSSVLRRSASVPVFNLERWGELGGGSDEAGRHGTGGCNIMVAGDICGAVRVPFTNHSISFLLRTVTSPSQRPAGWQTPQVLLPASHHCSLIPHPTSSGGASGAAALIVSRRQSYHHSQKLGRRGHKAYRCGDLSGSRCRLLWLPSSGGATLSSAGWGCTVGVGSGSGQKGSVSGGKALNAGPRAISSEVATGLVQDVVPCSRSSLQDGASVEAPAMHTSMAAPPARHRQPPPYASKHMSQMALLPFLHHSNSTILQVASSAPTSFNLAALSREISGLRWIGQGGGGAVFQAVWQGVSVAVKFLLTEADGMVDAAALEGVVSTVVHHPNVLHTYAFECSRLTETAFNDNELHHGSNDEDGTELLESLMESCTTISDSLNAARRVRMMQSLAAGGGGGGGGCTGVTFAPVTGGTSTTQRLSRLGMGELAPLTSVPLTSAPLAAHCSSDWVRASTAALLTEGGGGAFRGTNEEFISNGKEPAASASAKSGATATAVARLTNCLGTLSGPDGGCSAPSGTYAVPIAITTVGPAAAAAAAAAAATSSAATASTALAAEGFAAGQQSSISVLSGDGGGSGMIPRVLRNWFVDILGQQSSILPLSRAPSSSTKHKARGALHHHQLRTFSTTVPASSDADADFAIAAGG